MDPDVKYVIRSESSSSHSVLSDVDSHNDNEKGMLLPSEQATATRGHTRRRWSWILFPVSSLFFASLVYFVMQQRHLSCSCPGEQLSPFMSSIDRTYHSETGNAAFPDSAGHDAGNESWNNFTVSVEVGGDEIEDWWLDLGAYTAPVLVPLEYGSDFNFDPEKHAIVRPGDEAHGSGEVPYEGYPASIEVMHKLHCLNFLRQAAYYNHQYYRSIHGKPWHLNEHELVRHIGHCVDIFRQKIICEAEIELVPFVRSKGSAHRNDWARPKTCRNFEAVRSWLADHQWKAGDPHFYLDDHHHIDGTTVTKKPVHTTRELWRGF